MPNNDAHDTRTTVPANRATQAVSLNVAARAAPAASFTPLIADDFSTGALGTDTGWRNSIYSNVQALSGTQSNQLSTNPGTPPPGCGGSHGFGKRHNLPVVITEGYTIWQRMWMYFPTEFSFGFLYGVRDTTTMEESAVAGAASVHIVRPGTVDLVDGQALYFYLDNGLFHGTYVNGGTNINGGEVNLLDPLPSAISAGAKVKTFDEAEAKICGKNADASYVTGNKWLVFAPNVGTLRIYNKIGWQKRQIDQPANARFAIENEAGGNAGGSFNLPRNEWVELQFAVKVGRGTSGAAWLWANGELKSSATGIQTIGPEATGIDEWGLGDYWNGIPYTDGAPDREKFYVDEVIVATDMPGYGAPTGVDAEGNAYIDPATRVGDLA